MRVSVLRLASLRPLRGQLRANLRPIAAALLVPVPIPYRMGATMCHRTTTAALPTARPFVAARAVGSLARTHTCGALRIENVGEAVVLCGWLQQSRRVSSTLLFVPLRDAFGSTQLTVVVDENAHNMSERQRVMLTTLSSLTHDSVVRVTGTVRQRPLNMANKDMPTGSIEVVVESVDVLNRCFDLPFSTADKADNSLREELRLRYRYIDLRRPAMQGNIRMRSAVGSAVRKCLDRHGFIEVETPTLFKRTPEGAREFLVPTRSPGKFFALPQSPQQYKQMLMVGGVDRYFQFARCYRDEDLRADRQPEFTQIDIELSFVGMRDVQAVTEDVVVAAWGAAGKPLDQMPPFPRLRYAEAMEMYGVDKPDVRFEMKIADVTAPMASAVLAGVFGTPPAGHDRVRGFALPPRPSGYSRGDIESLEQLLSSDLAMRAPVTVAHVTSRGSWRSRLDKRLASEDKRAVEDATCAMEGGVIVLCHGDDNVTSPTLGKARLLSADWCESKGLRLRDPNLHAFLWVEDFPLFEPAENGIGLQAVHHPFTAPHDEDASKLFTDPLAVRGQHYDLVVNGWELGGGSIRIHHGETQKRVFQELLKVDPDTFRHLLDALSMGAPPHGGLALGFDRMMAVLCGLPSIRDVIAFPKSRSGADLNVNAPAEVSAGDLAQYGLQHVTPAKH